MVSRCHISIVLPVLNDDRVFSSIKRLSYLLKNDTASYEIIVSGVMQIGIPLAGQVVHVAGSGRKGDNIIQGLKMCSGDYVLIMDADFPITDDGLLKIIAHAGRDSVVIGYRVFLNTEKQGIIYFLRSCRTYIFRAFASMVIPEFSGIDPQFGVKLIRKDIALKYAFLARKSRGLSFDLDLLLRITMDNFKPKSIPLVYVHSRKSVVNPFGAGIELIYALLRLRSIRKSLLIESHRVAVPS
jgi:glycosyltransferase involved in cell wall biosynthesis